MTGGGLVVGINGGRLWLQWVLGAYAISYAGFVLLGGRSGDLLGRRRALLGGLGLLTVGSLASGMAGNLAVLLGGRLVQGLGAAITLPSALALIVTVFPTRPAT
jgi:MFS family permease